MRHILGLIWFAPAVLALADMGRAQTPDAEKEIKGLFQKAMELRGAGKHAEAITYFDKAVALAPKVFGEDTNAAGIYLNAGVCYYQAQRYKEAEPLLRRSLAIREAKINKGDSRIGVSLGALAATLQELTKHEEAETLFLRAITIHAANQDKRELGLTCNNLGTLYNALGRYAEAEVQFQRALQTRAQYLDKNNFDVAAFSHNLADTYRLMDRYAEAEKLEYRSMEIRVALLGKESLPVAQNLNMLGLLAYRQGRYKEAEKLLREALAIGEKKAGKDSLVAATYLLNLAIVDGSVGRVDEAETYYRRAVKIREKQLGPDHPSVANVLSALAVYLDRLGRTDEAEKHFTRSVAIQEAKLGKNHPQLSSTLVSLASLYLRQGRYREAEMLCRRAITITEERQGKDHIDLAPAVNNLAGVYVRMNRFEEARALYERALTIREAKSGKDHPDTCYSAGSLGDLCAMMGDFKAAQQHLDRAFKIAEASFGKDSPQVGTIMTSYAALYRRMGQPAQALKAQARGLEIHQIRLRDLFGYASESAMYDYLQHNDGKLPVMITMAFQAPDDPAATATALTWQLRLRGTVFDSLCRYRQMQILVPRDGELEGKLTRYRVQKMFLANAAISPPVGVSPEKLKKQVADAEREVTELDQDIRRELSRMAPKVVADRQEVTVAAVQEKLAPGSALIEFCHMPLRDFKKGAWTKHHYLAFVLTAGTNQPRLIDLGLAKPIDDGIEELRKEFADFQEKLRDCETAEEALVLEKAQEKIFAKKSAQLYARLFAPLRKELAGATQLYLACEASLNRLPFEVLVDPDGKYLIETCRCAYLSSGRDLLRTPGKRAAGTVVFAGPDYKLEADERLAQLEKLLKNPATTVASAKDTPRQVRSVGWKNLPGAAAEAKDIQAILGASNYGPVKAYVGKDALEEVLKAMPAPRVLHLATHGFFLDREPDAAEPDEEGAGAGFTRGRLKRMENPLLRSGIVLAGANTVGDKDSTARVDDGWVTAEEIALLNLQGTELVVLSACQSGLGDIKTGEGVYGLRRAFLYAGAETLVTSLFEVPDAETRELMKRFYTGVSAGQGKLQALNSAQRRFLEERRTDRGAAHPFFWASFVLVGNAD